MNKDTKFAIVIVISGTLLLANFIAFMSGAVELSKAKEAGKTGCDYQSLADFWPGRVIVCEFGRKRW